MLLGLWWSHHIVFNSQYISLFHLEALKFDSFLVLFLKYVILKSKTPLEEVA